MSRSKNKKAAPAPAQAKPAAGQVQPGRRMPLLVEAMFGFGRLGVTLAGVAAWALAYQAGATPLVASLRAAATVLGLGLLLWLATWLFVRGTLEVVTEQVKEAAAASVQTTVEVEA